MTLNASQPKPRKCQNAECGATFVPQRLGQRVCSPACALATKDKHQAPARKAIADRNRREIKARKEKLKSRAEHLKECQAIFNQYIRLRDADKPCVSCGRPATWDGQWHASHYRSVGSTPALRFNPLNVHRACSICNSHLSGNIMGYRPELVRRIGEEAVLALEGPHEPLKLTIEDIKALKAKFRARVRELKAATENYRGETA
ncbi:recombination protein NinG [Pseudomonas aeruginosa]|uniref:recombination protein NinG n=1 Tax=Pseudomonas aeruginosa TaxID=287 RepID=UPI00141A23EF|nr:recombination protein NinG [Pseudomonas aeruginosa]MBV6141862.1 recombination protein NinG [Pseudomonas aeruginosa]MBX6147014.1 recombination protein NinG [Pseudomonas aeruginosa]NHX92603.1 recombination protein NinG [Pseudomonas aeruginosa]NHY18462.1 recombination protein NinG [Pseudomonas aeruginosa]HBP6186267.1 recombination protein NinG [Pseudomonas aeruginosa]